MEEKYTTPDGSVITKTEANEIFGDQFASLIEEGQLVLFEEAEEEEAPQSETEEVDVDEDIYTAPDGSEVTTSEAKEFFGDQFEALVSDGQLKKKEPSVVTDSVSVESDTTSAQETTQTDTEVSESTSTDETTPAEPTVDPFYAEAPLETISTDLLKKNEDEAAVLLDDQYKKYGFKVSVPFAPGLDIVEIQASDESIPPLRVQLYPDAFTDMHLGKGTQDIEKLQAYISAHSIDKLAKETEELKTEGLEAVTPSPEMDALVAEQQELAKKPVENKEALDEIDQQMADLDKDRILGQTEKYKRKYFKEQDLDYETLTKADAEIQKIEAEIAKIESAPASTELKNIGYDPKFPQYEKQPALSAEQKKQIEEKEKRIEEITEANEALTSGAYSEAKFEIDRKLEQMRRVTTENAVKENNKLKEEGSRIEAEAQKKFGVPLQELGQVKFTTQEQVDEANALYKQAYDLQNKQKIIGQMYSNSATYFDAKTDKAIQEEFVGQWEGFVNQARKGWSTGWSVTDVMKSEMGVSTHKEAAQMLALEEARRRTMTDSKAMAQFNSAKSFTEQLAIFGNDPFEVIGGLAANSLAMMLPISAYTVPTSALAGSVIPGIATGLGIMGGMTMTSVAMEYGNSVMDAMRKKGVDVGNAEEVEKAFGNEEIMNEGRRIGLIRGITIAGFDLITAGVASRLVTPFTSKGMAIARGVATATAIDPVFEATGEGLAMLFSGQEVKATDMFAEALGGPGMAAPTTAMMIYNNITNKTMTDLAFEITDFNALMKYNQSESQINSWADKLKAKGLINEETLTEIKENTNIKGQIDQSMTDMGFKPWQFKGKKDVRNALTQIYSRRQELEKNPDVNKKEIKELTEQANGIIKAKEVTAEAKEALGIVEKTKKVEAAEAKKVADKMSVPFENLTEEQQQERVGQFQTQIDNVKQSLGAMVEGAKVEVAPSQEAFETAVKEAGQKVIEGENALVVFDADTSKFSHLVVNAAKANEKTVMHEAMHVVLQKTFGNDQAKFKEFQSEISGTLTKEGYGGLAKKMEAFANQDDYSGLQGEEFLAELGAALVSDGFDVKKLSGTQKTTLQKVAQAINKMVQTITNSDIQVFAEDASPESILEFLGETATKIKKGEDVTKKILTKREQRVKEQAKKRAEAKKDKPSVAKEAPKRKEKPKLTKVYHGGGSQITALDEGVLFVTTNKKEAERYAEESADSQITEFEVDENKLGQEELVYEAIDKLGLKSKDPDWTNVRELNVFELIDPNFETALPDADIKKVFKFIEEQGFEGVKFWDTGLQSLKQDQENIIVFNSKKTLATPTKKETSPKKDKPSVAKAKKVAKKKAAETKKKLKAIDKAKKKFGTVGRQLELPLRRSQLSSAVRESVASMPEAIKFANEQEMANQLEFKTALDARFLEDIDRLREEYGSSLSPGVINQAMEDYLTDAFTNETLLALDTEAGKEAVGWYDEKTKNALAIMGLIHPELNTDEGKRGMFTLATAITSNGNKVNDNFKEADRQYRYYQENGRFDSEQAIGTQGAGIKKSFEFLNKILDEGVSEMQLVDFLASPVTVGDLAYGTIEKGKKKKVGLISGYTVDEKVFGAAIFGPKIGNGFFMNLQGMFDNLTIDRWFMRQYGRLTGQLRAPKKDLIKKNKQKIASLLRGLSASERKVLREQVGKYKLSDIEGFVANVARKSAKLKVREALAAESETLDQLRAAANSMNKNIRAEVEAPNAATRKFIEKVFEKARQKINKNRKLEDQINTADMQAINWYPEKALYQAFKEDQDARKAEEEMIKKEQPDYESAAKTLAKKNKIDESQINKAIRDAKSKRSESIRETESKADDRARQERGKDGKEEVSQKVIAAKQAQTRRSQLVEGTTTPINKFLTNPDNDVTPTKEGYVIAYHQTPTKEQADNIQKEGVLLSKKKKVGDPMDKTWLTRGRTDYSKNGNLVALQVPKDKLRVENKSAGILSIIGDIPSNDVLKVYNQIPMTQDGNNMQREDVLRDFFTRSEGGKRVGKKYVENQAQTRRSQLGEQRQLETDLGLRKDGLLKKYLQTDKGYRQALTKAQAINRKLTREESPYKASITKVPGEKGDKRVYYAVNIVPRAERRSQITGAPLFGDPIDQAAIESASKVYTEQTKKLNKIIDDANKLLKRAEAQQQQGGLFGKAKTVGKKMPTEKQIKNAKERLKQAKKDLKQGLPYREAEMELDRVMFEEYAKKDKAEERTVPQEKIEALYKELQFKLFKDKTPRWIKLGGYLGGREGAKVFNNIMGTDGKKTDTYQNLKFTLRKMAQAARISAKTTIQQARAWYKVSRAMEKRLRKELNDTLRSMMKDTPSLTGNVIKAIMNKYRNTNIFNEESRNKFVDYLEKVIKDEALRRSLDQAYKNIKQIRDNIKKAKYGPDLTLVSDIKRLIALSPTLVPLDKPNVFQEYTDILNELGQKGKVIGQNLDEISALKDRMTMIMKEVYEQEFLLTDLSNRFYEYVGTTANILNSKKNPKTFSQILSDMVKDEIISEEERDLMADNKDMILSKETVEKKSAEEKQLDHDDAVVDVLDAIADVNEAIADEPGFFNTFPEGRYRDLAKKFVRTIKENKNGVVQDFTTTELKQMAQALRALTNGYVTNVNQEFIESIEGKIIDRNVNKVLHKAELRPFEKYVGIVKAFINRLPTGRDNATMWSEAIRRNPLAYVDQTLGMSMGRAIFKNLFEPVARGYSLYQNAKGKLNTKLKVAQEKLAKAYGQDSTAIAKAKFRIQAALLQQEYISNPNNTEVAPAIDFLKETLKQAKTTQKNEYSSQKNQEAIQEIIDKLKKGKTAEEQMKILMDDLDTPAKEAMKEISNVYKSMTKEYVYTATIIRGQEARPRKDYVHIQVTSPEKLGMGGKSKSIADEFMGPRMKTTKSGLLHERTPGAKPIRLDPFVSASSAVTETMMDYHLTIPMRTVSKGTNSMVATLDRQQERYSELKEEIPSKKKELATTKDEVRKKELEKEIKEDEKELAGIDLKRLNKEKEVADALRMAIRDVQDNILENDLIELTMIDVISEELAKAGYVAMLASPDRMAAEYVSNLAAAQAAFKPQWNKGGDYTSVYSNPQIGSDVMTNVGSTQIEKSYPANEFGGAMTEKVLDTSSFGPGRITSGMADRVNAIYNKMGINIHSSIPMIGGKRLGIKEARELSMKLGDWMITTPDQVVTRRVWFGSFAQKFEQEVQAELDSYKDKELSAEEKKRKAILETALKDGVSLEKIAANDQDYKNNFEDILEASRSQADSDATDIGAAKNPAMGLIKNMVSAKDNAMVRNFKRFNSFMTNFMMYEYAMFRKGIDAAVGKGDLTPSQGAWLAFAAFARMTSYTFLTTTLYKIPEMLFREDDDEEDEYDMGKEIYRSVANALLNLTVMKNFGNFVRGSQAWLMEEYGNKPLVQIFSEDKKYDSFDDSLVWGSFPVKSDDVKPWENKTIFELIATQMFGPFSPSAKTVSRTYTVAAKEPKTEEAKQKRLIELMTRTPFEGAGNLGFIPMYKLLRRVLLAYLYKGYKEQKKSKGYAEGEGDKTGMKVETMKVDQMNMGAESMEVEQMNVNE